MRMFGLSLGHLIVLGVVVLLFGGRRLPELGSALGRGLRAFRNGLDGKGDAANAHAQLSNQNPKDPQNPSNPET